MNNIKVTSEISADGMIIAKSRANSPEHVLHETPPALIYA